MALKPVEDLLSAVELILDGATMAQFHPVPMNRDYQYDQRGHVATYRNDEESRLCANEQRDAVETSTWERFVIRCGRVCCGMSLAVSQIPCLQVFCG